MLSRFRLLFVVGVLVAGTLSAVSVGQSSAAASVTTVKLAALSPSLSSGSTVAAIPPVDCFSQSCTLFSATNVGDYVDYSATVPAAGTYDVSVVGKQHSDRGIAQLSIKGAPNANYDGGYSNHGLPMDFYSDTDVHKTFSIGSVTLGTAGVKNFRFTITGKDAASSGYTIGLQSVVLKMTKAAVVSTPTTATTVIAPTSTGFVHPGVLLSGAQLSDVKAKIATKQEPWYSAYMSVKGSSYSSTAYTPHPVAEVKCGAHNNPDIGCNQEEIDGGHAYTTALMWVYTGNQAYADESIKILNAYSSTLKDHPFDTKLYTNGLLEAAWAGEEFTKTAEIIRYTNAGWNSADIQRFETMLNTAFLPDVTNTKTWAPNWMMSMDDAAISIGVFTNNRSVYNTALARWRATVPTIIQPSGQEGETCRDLGHMTMGMDALTNVAATATIQGDNLFAEQQTLITKAMEFNLKYANNPNASGWPCSAAPVVGGGANALSWEIPYAYYTSHGVSLPQTKLFLSNHRPTKIGLFMDWETLTSAGGPL